MRQPTSYQINRTSKLKITLRITSNSDRFFILLQPPSPSSPIVTITFNFRFTFFLSKQADRKTTTNRTIALSIVERISRSQLANCLWGKGELGITKYWENYILTDGTQGRFLELRQTAVVDGQVADVEAEEHVGLQLGQTVVPEPEIEDDSVGPSFERAHHIGDVRQIRVLAYDVQSGFLQGAGTGRDFGVRWA